MTASEQAVREKIVEVARSWVGTPYFACQQKKGRGCDCGSFLAGVYAEAGIIPKLELGNYDWTSAWAKAGGDELYLGTIGKYGSEIEEYLVGPGDIVMYHVGRGWSHGAIVASWPGEVIHSMRNMGVVSSPANTGFLAGRQRRYWSVF